jgi:putative membrane-bound dehydrogenase-like protein
MRTMSILLVCLPLIPLSFASAAEWTDVTVPDVWRKVPSGERTPIDGYSWYRAFVGIPEEWEGDDLTLFVEALDDARSGWVNGTTVGVNGSFPPTFRSGLGEAGRFSLPAELVQAGSTNTIAIRVYQSDPRTNFNVAPPVLMNTKNKQAIRMNGRWQYRPGDDLRWARPPATTVGIAIYDVFTRVDQVDDMETYVAQRDGDQLPLSVEQAADAFQVPDDLRIEVVLSEPEIAQPLFMTWDERGRLWVMEYRQYPEPAGLTMLSRDVYLRSVYDKVPDPPPHGTSGQDCISIHEDTNGDGKLDSHKTFVDGLNIATSMAIGRGGVYVTNPPYLLFYPDKNSDDVPDDDPQVLLEGFGIEDSHSVINSIRFGPDGWLYGCQGSTVTAQVREPGSTAPPIRTSGQQIWRYHPEQKQFEVFAEGGGNAFGLEIDSKGRIYSGHNGGDTRGFHYVQGGYYRKGFAKHGALSNPYTFGYFEAIRHHQVPRFTHNFVIYESTQLPSRYRGNLFGIEPLQGQVVQSDVKPYQSSFETSDINRAIRTDDPWFRPVDIKVGPDGAVYVADMYEQRIDHSSHYAGRVDRSNGRIWKLSARDARPVGFDVVNKDQLLRELTSPDHWRRQTAIRMLGDQPDSSLAAALFKQTQAKIGNTAIASLWGLHAVGGLTSEASQVLLSHRDEFVREWIVRLLADGGRLDEAVASRLADLAAIDESVHVRKQLAASARRLPSPQAIPIIEALLRRDEDAADIHQPLMIWWAVEAMCSTDVGRKLITHQLLKAPEMWQRPLVNEHLLERLTKRLILSGTRDELLTAASLLRQSPDHAGTQRILAALETGLEGRSLTTMPQPLLDAIDQAGGGSEALQLRQGKPAAVEAALVAVVDPQTGMKRRLQLVEILGDIRITGSESVLLRILKETQDDQLLEVTMNALHSFSGEEIGTAVIARLPQLSTQAQTTGTALLATRPEWTMAALTSVAEGHLSPAILSKDVLRKMLLHPEPDIQKAIQSEWGEIEGTTTAEMAAETNRLRQILASGSGNPKQGKPHYMKNCGRCHRLFGEGGQVGPDLTAFQRDDLPRLLQNIVNPDLEIREGFENFLILSGDGRVATGFLASQDDRLVVLRTNEGASHTFLRDEIDEMRAMPQSVMPSAALKDLTDQQIRDLFAYLRSSQPVNY